MKNLNIENPVDKTMQFMSSVQNVQEEVNLNTAQDLGARKPIPIQERSKTDKNGRELKRKRYNLLLIPTIYNDIGKIAYVEKISKNEAINQALKLYRETKKDILAKHDRIEKLKMSKITEEDG